METIVVDGEGIRLDRFVSRSRPELSRTYVQKLVAGGYITVNGQGAKPSLLLNPGDQVEITLPPPSPSPLSAESIPLNIIYEDNDLMVIDKPAGLTVHPAPGNAEHTLVNAVMAHFPALAEISDSTRPGIVHRLDKDTSGLIIVAKTRAAQTNLEEQFKSRSVVKVYQALVKGRLTPERGAIEADIGRNGSNRKLMAVVNEGREAVTHYRVIKYAGDATLVEVTPKTGRTHQIRVHFAAIGHPLVGDTTYGGESPYLPRQFLHACKLGFKLPSGGRQVEFTSPLPRDLQEALEAVEKQRHA